LGGATGGCVSAKKEVVDILRQKGRPYLFSNALMPAVVQATMRVLELLSESTQRRDKLEQLTAFWRDSLIKAGFDIKPGTSPIVPIMLYNAQLSQDISRDLWAEGLYAVGFFYPVVPKGQARIRTQMSASLEKADLEKALEVLIRVGKKYDILGKSRSDVVARYGE